MKARARAGAVSTGVLALLVAALLVLALAAAAHAAGISDEEELTRFGSEGSGAGKLSIPQGVATDPTTGQVLIVDSSNDRIDEFTPWGGFVKAFGWDVAPGAVNEQQEVRVRASSGQFKLSFGAGGPGVSETSSLPFDASAAEVKTALNALVNISTGGGSVGVEAVPGQPSGKTPYIYVIAFRGSLGAKDVAQLTASNGTTPLSGGNPATELEVRTRADGTPGGTGLEYCTAESGCQKGLEGGGAGELNGAAGVAVDAAGAIFVKEAGQEAGNLRVQKFDPAGRFLLTFGGKVDKTKVEAAAPEAEQNRCTAASGDVCQAGTAGTAPGQFSNGFFKGIALGSGGELYAADKERIQRFDLEGEFEASIPIPGHLVQHLAFDPIGGDLYAKFDSEGDIHKLDATSGAEVGLIKDEGALGMATNSAGDLFATGVVRPEGPLGVVEFDSEGKSLSPPSCCVPPPPPSGQVLSHFAVEGLGTNAIGDLYVSYSLSGVDGFARVFGPPPVTFESPPPVPPEIVAQFASSVQSNEATVAADINPHFFVDTRYFVQYGTGQCRSGGCDEETPVSPGALLSSKVSGLPVRSGVVSLEGLQPGTTYHYRFVAQSNGGGPVYGINPDEEGPEEASLEAGLEAAFTTPEVLPGRTCSNQNFRGGTATHLPDCRAYEMVSPVDKNNADILAIPDLPRFETGLSQSSSSGEKMTYSSYRSFGDSEGSPFTNQYIASRDPASGWSSEAIDPPEDANVSHANAEPPALASIFENPYKAFSADLCQGWLTVTAEPPLAAGALPGYDELYRRDNCGAGGYEALVPIEAGTEKFTPVLEGTSGNGAEAVLLAKNLNEAGWRAYYASNGMLRPVCVLPSGSPSGGHCSAGTSHVDGFTNPEDLDRMSTLTHAISRDGSRVYWTATSEGYETGPGRVYLRLNPDQPESAHLHGTAEGTGNLIGPAKATGNLVSGSKTITKVNNAGSFGVGQAITGEGIQAGTTVEAVEAEKEKLKISKEAKLTQNGVELTGPASVIVAGVHTTHGAFAAGQEISAANGGIPPATTIVAVEEVSSEVFKLTLSAPASHSGSAIGLEATSACVEVDKACTLKVSGTKTNEAAEFLAASDDGSKALFEVREGTLAGKLFEFDLAGATREVAGEVVGVAGGSEDLAQIYFVSKEVLGSGAIAGKPNLYLDEGGTKTFIATLTETDVEIRIPSDTNNETVYHAARVNSDGGTLAFISTASLTGYDNTDQATGKADSEVYIYEVGASGPICVSCNPSGARPRGRVVQGVRNSNVSLATAAGLAMPTTTNYSPRVLLADGRRVFFDSFDALLPGDTNGKEDVYEWEAASSQEECEEAGAELYSEADGGCLSLISSGESPSDSEFLDASESGDDAFFTTSASLVSRDPGLIDVYDARVGGGFPEPNPPAACEGEACQSPPEAPNDPTPASASFEGAGNVHEEPLAPKRPCAKDKVRRHGKCVAKKHQAKHKRAKRKRGEGR